MNSEFSTKLSSGHPYQHVPEEYKEYCSIEPEKRAYKVQSLKNVLLRKSSLKLLRGYKDEKIRISVLHAPIWLWDVWKIHVLILQSLLKSVERSANFEKCTFEKIDESLTKFDPISRVPTYFLQTAPENNNKGTLKVCRKITKITDPNSGFFLDNGANLKMKFPSELSKLSI